MKEWECVEVKRHKDIGKTVEEYQREGWRLHTYQTAGMGAGPMAYNVNHCVLFERTLGELEELSMIEGAVLEVRGANGVLRIDLSEEELRKMLFQKKD